MVRECVCTLGKLSVGGCEVCILYGVCKLQACYGHVVFVYGYVWGVHVVIMLWVGCVIMGMYCAGCACCGYVMGELCDYGYYYVVHVCCEHAASQLPVCGCECVMGRLLSPVCMCGVYYVWCVCCGQVVCVWECGMHISCGVCVCGG